MIKINLDLYGLKKFGGMLEINVSLCAFSERKLKLSVRN